MCPHEVQFYEHETFLVDRVGAFLSDALQAGDCVVVIATPAHRAAFTERLRRGGILEQGHERFIALDARETLAQFMVNDWPDQERFDALLGAVIVAATRGGVLRLRAFGEMVALLCADGKPQAALRLEQLWNQLAGSHDFSLLCAYPIEAFGADTASQVFDAICSAHSHVSPCEAYRSLPADVDGFHRRIASLQQKAQALEREVAKRAQAELAIRRLAAHREHIREDERKRIAREIHDELGSLLTGIKAYISVVQERAVRNGRNRDPHLSDAAALADTAIASMRRIITDLRPSVLDQLGIWAAIEWYAGQIEKQSGLACSLEIDAAAAAIELDAQSCNAVFRIVQEAFTNAVRHAQASRIEVKVQRTDEEVTVTVTDDGIGLDDSAGGAHRESWGIAGMHERARNCGADLTLTALATRGTTVALSMPLGTPQ